MRLFLLSLVLSTSCLAGCADEFDLGVGAFEVGSREALLWTHVVPGRAGGHAVPLFAEVALDAGFTNVVRRSAVVATPRSDFTVRAQVRNLAPDTDYMSGDNDPAKVDTTYLPHIEEGFAKAGGGKSLSDFAIVPGVTVIVGDDLEKARMPVKMNLALYIGGMGARNKNFYNDLAKRLGYEEAAAKIQDLFLDGKKAEATAAVPDELVDAVHVVGPADRIRDRLQAWKEAGKKGHVHTMMVGTPQPEALELLAEELL